MKKVHLLLLLLGTAAAVAVAWARIASTMQTQGATAGDKAFEQKARQYLRQVRHNPGGLNTASMLALQKMGLSVVPVLAEALDDESPTAAAWMAHRHGWHRARMNEVAAQIIRRVAERDFAVMSSRGERTLRDVGELPETAPLLKRQVLAWYAENGHKTPLERKLDEVHDPFFRNRLDALEWLGRRRATQGRRVIIDRIETLFTEETVNTSKDTELSYCALALGRIGGSESHRVVRRVCAHLTGYATGPPDSQDYFRSYILPNILFPAYQGLAHLEGKEKTLNNLRALHARHRDQMSSNWQFERSFKRAKQEW